MESTRVLGEAIAGCQEPPKVGLNSSTATIYRHAETMTLFRKIDGRRIGLPSMKWMMEFGAFVMRTETELVTKGRWVVPGRLTAENFWVKWPNLTETLADLKARLGEGTLIENVLAGNLRSQN